MAAFVGRQGVVKIGASAVAEVTEWSYEESGDPLAKPRLGMTAMEYLPNSALTEGSGSITCHFDPDDSTGQGAMTHGASVSLVLQPEGAATGDVEFSGTVEISSVSWSGGAEGIPSAAFSYRGELTRGTVA